MIQFRRNLAAQSNKTFSGKPCVVAVLMFIYQTLISFTCYLLHARFTESKIRKTNIEFDLKCHGTSKEVQIFTVSCSGRNKKKVYT